MLKEKSGVTCVLLLAVFILLGSCAEMGDSIKGVTRDVTDLIGISELPQPIATSLEAMPRDAAIVADAIERQIAGRGNVRVENIIFMQAARTQLAVVNLPGSNFERSAVHLYEYKAFPDNPVIKKSTGRLLYEAPSGQSTSLLYEAQFRRGMNGIIIDYAAAKPYFPPSPELELFVVDAARMPADDRQYPKSYPELKNFIKPHAMPSKESSPQQDKVRNYLVFVFVNDKISPTARLEVKKSTKPVGLDGFTESTKFYHFNGWSVARIPAKIILYSEDSSPPLYIKVVFTPGRESGLIRRPKLIGQFHLSGSELPKE